MIIGILQLILPQHVSTTSHDLLASPALPDTGALSLDRVLTAERAVVLGVLGNFHLLDDLSQGSTISAPVLTANSSLLSVSLHFSQNHTTITTMFFTIIPNTITHHLY